MPVCVSCGKEWPPYVRKCPTDGTSLGPAAAADAKADPPAKAASEIPAPPLTAAPADRKAPSAGPAVAAVVLGPSGELETGTMIGEYKLETKIGEGGMATVYSAVHPLIGKKAA